MICFLLSLLILILNLMFNVKDLFLINFKNILLMLINSHLSQQKLFNDEIINHITGANDIQYLISVQYCSILTILFLLPLND